MFSNSYIGENVARERTRDFQRQAQRDQHALLASTSAKQPAYGPRLRQPRWTMRLLAALIGLLP